MKIEIFEEDGENTLLFGDKYADFTIDVYPDLKTYQSRMNLKDDVYYRTEKFEYRIQANPIKVETRLIERIDEPPKRCCVKDGVVLESDILVDRGEVTSMGPMTKDFIDTLKKEVEWHEDWVGNPVAMYILFKHPEIVGQEDCRRYLRQLSERIKNATLKIEKSIEKDEFGFQIKSDEETYIGMYKDANESLRDYHQYQKLKDEDKDESAYGKKLNHLKKIKEIFFDKNSKEYVGISEGEFGSSKDILKNIETFLNKKSTPVKKEVKPKISKTKGFVISLFLTLFLAWVVSLFVGINPFLIFGIVQVIVFTQSIIGVWLGRFFE